jgi:hypothetical protein
MANPKARNIAILVFIFLIVVAFFRITPFILAPFGLFPVNIAHFIKNAGQLGAHWWNPGFAFGFPGLIAIALLVLWIAVIIWVFRDAESRGMNGFLWALLVFIGNVLALIIYLIIRQEGGPEQALPSSALPCPSCGKPVGTGFAFCPFCGTRIHSTCPECQNKVESIWLVCPHCGHKLREEPDKS